MMESSDIPGYWTEFRCSIQEIQAELLDIKFLPFCLKKAQIPATAAPVAIYTS
jgi:hypothetical protein